MNDYQTLYLDSLLLPNYTGFKEVTTPNATKSYTLDGTLNVDFYNNRRAWEISWNLLSLANYQAIRAKYNKQFTNSEFLTFHINDLDLWLPVYIEIPTIDIRFNGQWVEGFSIRLEERDSIS